MARDWEIERLAGAVLYLTEEQTAEMINGDEKFNNPLIEMFGVDFQQFWGIAEALLRLTSRVKSAITGEARNAFVRRVGEDRYKIIVQNSISEKLLEGSGKKPTALRDAITASIEEIGSEETACIISKALEFIADKAASEHQRVEKTIERYYENQKLTGASYYEFQRLAGAALLLTEEQTAEIINGDEDFDTPLTERFGVDFWQFQFVAQALLRRTPKVKSAITGEARNAFVRRIGEDQYMTIAQNSIAEKLLEGSGKNPTALRDAITASIEEVGSEETASTMSQTLKFIAHKAVPEQQMH